MKLQKLKDPQNFIKNVLNKQYLTYPFKILNSNRIFSASKCELGNQLEMTFKSVKKLNTILCTRKNLSRKETFPKSVPTTKHKSKRVVCEKKIFGEITIL